MFSQFFVEVLLSVRKCIIFFYWDYAKFVCFSIENIMRSKKSLVRKVREHSDSTKATLPEFRLVFLGMEKNFRCEWLRAKSWLRVKSASFFVFTVQSVLQQATTSRFCQYCSHWAFNCNRFSYEYHIKCGIKNFLEFQPTLL